MNCGSLISRTLTPTIVYNVSQTKTKLPIITFHLRPGPERMQPQTTNLGNRLRCPPEIAAPQKRNPSSYQINPVSRSVCYATIVPSHQPTTVAAMMICRNREKSLALEKHTNQACCCRRVPIRVAGWLRIPSCPMADGS